MKMHRTPGRTAALLRILSCTVALAGMGVATNALAQAKQVIAVSVADQKSLFYVAAVDGMRDAAKKIGRAHV